MGQWTKSDLLSWLLYIWCTCLAVSKASSMDTLLYFLGNPFCSSGRWLASLQLQSALCVLSVLDTGVALLICLNVKKPTLSLKNYVSIQLNVNPDYIFVGNIIVTRWHLVFVFGAKVKSSRVTGKRLLYYFCMPHLCAQVHFLICSKSMYIFQTLQI